MARIVGVDVRRQKGVGIGLSSVFGMGPTREMALMEKMGMDPRTRVNDLTDEQANTLTNLIQNDYKVEGDLRREVTGNVKRLMEINCYRGIRHKRGLPVRGQRTHTNARTRKGPRRTAIKQKAS